MWKKLMYTYIMDQMKNKNTENLKSEHFLLKQKKLSKVSVWGYTGKNIFIISTRLFHYDWCFKQKERDTLNREGF